MKFSQKSSFSLVNLKSNSLGSFNPNGMKNELLRKTIPTAATAALFCLLIGSAFGQAAKVVGDKPEFDDFLSPEFSGGKQKTFKAKEWLDIEVKLKVSLAPEPKSKTCDKLLIKWYVAVKNPDKPGTMLLLTKDIEHVNIPLDEDIYCSVYLSPASIKRLTGIDRAGKSSVEGVGYEILVNGEKVASETTKWRVGWWAVASDKISRSEAVPLLDKTETPFRAMWWDRYAEVSENKK
jgi:hypothetical protein